MNKKVNKTFYYLVFFTIAFFCTIGVTHAEDNILVEKMTLIQKYNFIAGNDVDRANNFFSYDMIDGKSQQNITESFKVDGYHTSGDPKATNGGGVKLEYSCNLNSNYQALNYLPIGTKVTEKRQNIMDCSFRKVIEYSLDESHGGQEGTIEDDKIKSIEYSLANTLTMLKLDTPNAKCTPNECSDTIKDTDKWRKQHEIYLKDIHDIVKDYTDEIYTKYCEYIRKNLKNTKITVIGDDGKKQKKEVLKLDDDSIHSHIAIYNNDMDDAFARDLTTICFTDDLTLQRQYIGNESSDEMYQECANSNTSKIDINNKEAIKQSEIENGIKTVNQISYLNNMYDVMNDYKGNTYYVCVNQQQYELYMTYDMDLNTLLKNSGASDLNDKAKLINYCEGIMGSDAALFSRRYEIKDSNVQPVKNTSAYFTCSWTYTGDSDVGDVSMGFTTSISLTSNKGEGRIRMLPTKNLKSVNASVFLEYNELKSLLNDDYTLLDSMKKGITTTSPQEVHWAAVGAVVVSAIIIAAKIILTVASGGSLGVVMVAGTVLKYGIIAAVFVIADFEFGKLAKYAGTLTNEYGAEAKFLYQNGQNYQQDQSKMKNLTCSKSDPPSSDTGKIDHNYNVTCESIMSGNFGKIVKTIMNILRFVGVALLVLFGAMDFIKPIVSGDQDQLRKSGGTFVKRIIVLVLILFVPTIVELLLSLIGRDCSTGL